MARHKRMESPEEDEPGLDISSLIDVCFLLLIYFLVTTQIIKQEQEISSGIPSKQLEGTPPEFAPLLIILEANGNIFVKGEAGSEELVESDPDSRELPDLSERLELFKSSADSSGGLALVQVRVDGKAVQQRVMDIVNALAGANIDKITFTDLLDEEAGAE